jgi:hypothetical protein
MFRCFRFGNVRAGWPAPRHCPSQNLQFAHRDAQGKITIRLFIFMTADSNLAEPFTGIGISELQDFLRRRPMSQKALLLLDICHAGAAAGQLGRPMVRV